MGCAVSVPTWDERGRWHHMDSAHRDSYGDRIGGYDTDWKPPAPASTEEDDR